MKVQQWTGRLACVLQGAADLTNERFAERLGIGTRTVAYWHSRPNTVPGHDSQAALSAYLGNASDAVRKRFAEGANVSWLSSNSDSGPSETVSATIQTAADAVSTDPILLDGDFDPNSVESLQEEMAILARAGNKSALDIFLSARQLRNEARTLTERARKPSILTDLYVVVGQATALMASTAFDLGHWNESAELARASTKYAGLAGHASLEAWTYGLRMTLANWRNEPDAALVYMNRGMRVAPAGEPKLRLRYIAARSHALTGNASAVSELLIAAQTDRDDAERRPDDLSASTGGEFTFGEARAAACAAAAWLDLGIGDEAAKYAAAALSIYEAMPEFRRPYSQVSGAQIDIATARLHMRDHDGARAALGPVIHLPPGRWNVSLRGRIEKVRNVLALPPWNDEPEAGELAEQLAVWLTDATDSPRD